uniref:Maturase K n=1 Tax=Parascaris univalens TaxID=6257 RepID=A0A915C3V5_PARUN
VTAGQISLLYSPFEASLRENTLQVIMYFYSFIRVKNASRWMMCHCISIRLHGVGHKCKQSRRSFFNILSIAVRRAISEKLIADRIMRLLCNWITFTSDFNKHFSFYGGEYIFFYKYNQAAVKSKL